MKRSIVLMALLLILAASCIVYVPRDEGRAPGPDRYDSSPGSYGDQDVSVFYDTLSPFGTWVRMSAYGYVWVPRNMGYRWRPYTYGRWIWSDYGWTWISDDEWGWIPFHYGRWGWDDDIGWFWVPGTVWGPAWVFWRTSDLYFGWAPLPPGLDFDLRFGFRSRRYDIPDRYWVFVPCRDFFEPDLYRRALPFERNGTIIRATALNDRILVRDAHVINQGLDPADVRGLTGQPVQRYILRDARQAGPDQVSGGEVRIYRPGVRTAGSSQPKEYLDSSAARTRLSEAKIYEPGLRSADADAMETVRRRNAEESQILERSQTDEIRRLDQRFAERETGARAAAERAKIRREHETAVTDLKTRHGQEKQALTERQKKDQENVSRRAVRRK
jgi:hypothetical protein